jgi:hypothetical protein
VGFLVFLFFVFIVCPLLLLGLVFVVLAMFSSFFNYIRYPKVKYENLEDRLARQSAAYWRKVLEEPIMTLNRPLKD